MMSGTVPRPEVEGESEPASHRVRSGVHDKRCKEVQGRSTHARMSGKNAALLLVIGVSDAVTASVNLYPHLGSRPSPFAAHTNLKGSHFVNERCSPVARLYMVIRL